MVSQGAYAHSQARSTRAYHYKKIKEVKANRKAQGLDPDDVEAYEREPYKYQQENYDSYV